MDRILFLYMIICSFQNSFFLFFLFCSSFFFSLNTVYLAAKKNSLYMWLWRTFALKRTKRINRESPFFFFFFPHYLFVLTKGTINKIMRSMYVLPLGDTLLYTRTNILSFSLYVCFAINWWLNIRRWYFIK